LGIYAVPLHQTLNLVRTLIGYCVYTLLAVVIIMKISRPKTEKWHNYEEGDCGKPIDRDGSNKAYFKKGWWKRYDRKKFFRNISKWFE